MLSARVWTALLQQNMMGGIILERKESIVKAGVFMKALLEISKIILEADITGLHV